MTETFLKGLKRRYRAYVDTFRDADGELPQMLRLKLDHTMNVVAEAQRIMAEEAFPAAEQAEGEACALLHDTGRYAQFMAFGTFEDVRSVDHADQGVEVICGKGWLDSLPERERKRVLDAVRYHNKRELPDTLAPETRKLAFLVRDADKLDIFRVLEEAIQGGMLETHPEIAWGLPADANFSPLVADAVRRGRSVQYTWVKSIADFVLIQVGWLNGGLHFRAALRMAQARGVLEFRRAFLKNLTRNSGVDQICDLVRESVLRRLGGG